MKTTIRTRAATEVHRFSPEVPRFWERKTLSRKHESETNTTATGNEKSHGLGTQRESMKKKMANFRRFLVQEPRHSETVSDENVLPLS